MRNVEFVKYAIKEGLWKKKKKKKKKRLFLKSPFGEETIKYVKYVWPLLKPKLFQGSKLFFISTQIEVARETKQNNNKRDNVEVDRGVTVICRLIIGKLVTLAHIIKKKTIEKTK